MSDQLPIVEVPESTWLRALAHALDPEAETPDESLTPEDEPVAGSVDDVTEVDDDRDDDDDADDGEPDDGQSVSFDDADQHDWDPGDLWSADDPADAPDHLHHDDGTGIG